MTLQRSFIWSILQFASVLAIELAGIVVLARLLTPTEMGQYAIAFAFVGLGQFVANFGLNIYVVRGDDMGLATRQKLAGLSLGIGGAVTVVLGLIALSRGGGYLEPPLAALVLFMAGVPLIGWLNTVERPLLLREMRFRAFFVLRVAAALSFQAVAIPLALADAGPMSLACGLLASTLISSLTATALNRGAFLVRPTLRGVRGIVSFTGVVFSTQVFQRLNEAVVPILMGQWLSYGAVGLFTRSMDLVMHAKRPVMEGIVPVLSPLIFRTHRRGEPLKPICLQSMAYLSAVCWPIAGAMIVLAEPIVLILLGPQWTGVAPLLRILALTIVLTPITAVLSTVGLALGLERMFLRLQAVVFAGYVVVTLLFAQAGLIVFCSVLMILILLNVLATALIVTPRLAITLADQLRATWRSGAATFAFLVPLASMTRFLSGTVWTDLTKLALGGLIATAVWLGALIVLNHPIRSELMRHWPRGRVRQSEGT